MSDLGVGLVEEIPRCPVCGAPYFACGIIPEDVAPAERPGWFRRVADAGPDAGPCPPTAPVAPEPP